MEHFDDSLPILQNFEKNIWMQKSWLKFNQVILLVHMRSAAPISPAAKHVHTKTKIYAGSQHELDCNEPTI